MRNWFTSLFRRTTPSEKRGLSIADLRGVGYANVAGVHVDEKSALNLSTVFACIKVISEDIASLSLPVYERMENGGKKRNYDHPTYYLLHDEPNPEMTSMQFRETMLQFLLRWGNSYAEIERSNGGQAIAMHILPPTSVEPKRENGKLIYKINDAANHTRGILKPEDIIHLRLMGDGILGYSPIKMAQSAIALGVATETFGSAFFGNSARPGGVISHPDSLSETAVKNLRESLNNVHGGPENYGKWMVLEEGAAITPFAIPPNDSQFLETRNFQVAEICRIYRVPPHMIGDLSRATFSNVEQQSLDYVKNTIRPMAVRIEQEYNRKLFSEGERNHFFCEHLLDSILRGDLASRTSALKEQFLNGAITLDEWRATEGRNPIEDASQHFLQAQMRTLEQIQAGEEEPPQDEPEPEVIKEEPQEPEDNKDAVRAVISDSLGRMIRREVKAVQKAAQHPNEFLKRLDEFYQSHETFMADAITPAMGLVDGDAKEASKDICNRHHNELLDISGEVTADDLPNVVNRWVEELEKKTPEIINSLGA